MTSAPRRLLLLALSTVALGALSALAFGFWTTGGFGAAPSVAGTLGEPGVPSVSATNGVVSLDWAAASPPGAGTVDYRVERFDENDSTWTDVCGTSPTIRITTTTCSDVPGAGTYVWQVTANFSSWTATSDVSDALNVDDPDSTPPTGAVTAPAAGAIVRGTAVAVTSDSADAESGVASARFQRAPHGGSTWTTIGAPDTVSPYSVAWDTTAVTDGLYDLRVVTTDNVGNAHTSAAVTNVRVDNTAPVVSIALAAGANNAATVGSTVFFNPGGAGNFGLVATVTDAGSGAASATFPVLTAAGWTTHAAETVASPVGGPYSSTTFTWVNAAGTPGAYTVTATDVAGNSSTSTVSFAAETTAPSGSVTAPGASTNVRATVTVTADSADTQSGVASAQFQISTAGAGSWSNLGTADVTAPYSTTWTTTSFTDGLYDLRVVTTDNVGNAFTSAAVTSVRVDNTAPAVSLALAASPTGAFFNAATSKVYFKANAAGSYRLVATVTDAGSGGGSATFPILSAAGWTTHAAETVSTPANGPFTSSSFVWANGASAPGTYTVTVTDAAGNTATSAVTFTIDSTAPTGSVTAPAAAANVRGSAVAVTSSSADASSGVASAQFQSSPTGAGSWSNLGAADTVTPYAATWDTTAFADGLYDLRVITTDNVGNTFTSATIAGVRVDNTAPSGSVTAPATNGVLRGAITMSTDSADVGSGVTSVQFQRSPAGTNTWSSQGAADTTAPYAVTWTTTTSTPDGLYDLRAVTTDKAGNSFTSPVVTNLRVDNTAPTGAVTAPAASANVRGTAVAVTSSSADAGSGVATVQFQSTPHSAATWTSLGATLTGAPYAVTWDTTTFADALYDLRVITTDVAGNVTTSATIASVRVDNTAPTGVITAPLASANLRATVTISANSADTGSGVSSALFQRSPAGTNTWTNVAAADTTSPYSASWVTTGVTDGLYDLQVITTDKAGNTFTSALTTVRVDNTVPTVSTVVAPGATGAFRVGTKIYFKASAAGSFSLVATVTDAGSGPASASFPVQATAGWTHAVETVTTPSGGPYSSSAFTWTSGASAPGTYTVTVADAAGNTATSAFTFTIDSTAPTGSVTAPAAAANVRGSAVAVTSNSADAGSGVASAQFQVSPAGAGTWSNLGAADTVTPYATTWDTTAFADGLYDLRVITTDNLATTFTSATIAGVRVDNTAPSGSVTAPATNAFVSGASVAVSANSADSGSGVSSAQFQTSPRGAGTWTNLGAADTTSPYSVTWNTTSGFADGRYDVRVVTTDKAGNTFTSPVIPVEVQNAAPNTIAVQLVDGGGTAGRVQAGDRIVVTYSETLGVASLCSTWSGNLTDQSLSGANDVTVTLTDGGAGNDTVTVTSATCTFHLGTLNLGAVGYVTSGNRTFSGSGASASTITWDATNWTLTVTLGASAGAGTLGTVGTSTATYTPDSAIKNAVGTAISGSFSTGSVVQF